MKSALLIFVFFFLNPSPTNADESDKTLKSNQLIPKTEAEEIQDWFDQYNLSTSKHGFRYQKKEPNYAFSIKGPFLKKEDQFGLIFEFKF